MSSLVSNNRFPYTPVCVSYLKFPYSASGKRFLKVFMYHHPILTIIPAPCYLRLKERFLAHEFSENFKFCCRSNVHLSLLALI